MMNIFFLDLIPMHCAKMHCDKHVTKMLVEYAQLMCTAHRVLDGTPYDDVSKNGYKVVRYKMDDSEMEEKLYLACHINHPSAKWVRESSNNYLWLALLWIHLHDEYRNRYGRNHMTYEKLKDVILRVPKNISNINEFTEPPQAMPDDVKVEGDVVTAYRNYYIKHKKKFATWKNEQIPEWYLEGIAA